MCVNSIAEVFSLKTAAKFLGLGLVGAAAGAAGGAAAVAQIAAGLTEGDVNAIYRAVEIGEVEVGVIYAAAGAAGFGTVAVAALVVKGTSFFWKYSNENR